MTRLKKLTVGATVGAALAFAGVGVADNGKLVFQNKACDTCHSVSTAKIKAKIPSLAGPDLIDVDKTFDRDKFTAFIRQEIQIEGKKHPRQLKSTEEELRLLLDFCFSQRSPGRPAPEPPAEDE